MRKLLLSAGMCWMCMAVHASGDSSYIYHQQAKNAYASRQYNAADKFFNRAIALDSTNPQLRIDYAHMLFDRNLYLPAREHLRAALRQHPDHIPTLRVLFEDANRHHSWADVLHYGPLLMAVAPAPHIEEAMASALYYTDDNYGAIQLLEKQVQQQPSHAKYVMLGRCYNDVNDHQKAIAAYRKATELDSTKSRTWYELALLYVTLPDYAMAVASMEQAAKFGEKQDAVFVENLANLYMQTKDFQKGIGILEKLLDNRPGDTHSMFLVAQAYYQNKDYKKAVEWWEKSLEVAPGMHRSLYMIGMAYQKMGREDKGKAICDEAIAKDPNLAKMRMQVDFGNMY